MKFSPYTSTDQKKCLPSLLNYLAQNPPAEPHIWQEWYVERIFGGQNNLLYHANHPCGDVAVKLTQIDERNRAMREFNTLLVLQEAGLQIAPRPLALDVENEYGRQIVVQSWLEGEVNATPPQSEAEWSLFLDHLLRTHTVLPKDTAVHLPSATLSAAHPDQVLFFLRQRIAQLPAAAITDTLRQLMAKLETKQYPDWPPVQTTLIHCDCNPRNFVRRPSGWLSVDWENSGWGDPALEVADVMAHAGMMTVPLDYWPQFAQVYADRCGDKTAVSRVWAYYPLLLTYWVAIFSKGMYDLAHDVPHERLAPRPLDWAQMMPIKYNHYLNLAQSVIQ